MTNQELNQIAGMIASCSGIVVFILSAILGAILESKINWFKW